MGRRMGKFLKRQISMRCSRWALALVALGAVFAPPRHAAAVVEQIDGQVVPQSSGAIQSGLDAGEGTPGMLHAIFDARIAPEVFAVPESGGQFGSVQFDDLMEGAGYENSFGWYNVSDPSTLHQVMPCSDEPGASRTVDFEAQFQAGHYLGGYIGFFLITPEGQPNPNNCGEVGNEGHTYFTEQALNGDGNYVHYLVYTSKADPLAYYFGFEDLWRGGDNDFEDMLVKVTGLITPCVPSPEICDGDDNNCDGLIDNNPVDAGGDCGNPAVGECKPGKWECSGSSLTCVGEIGPSTEYCDGLDNDCDTVIDNSPADVGTDCGIDTGECEFGTNDCIGGALVCVGGVGPSPEICDTKDNDCNGPADDNTVDTGGACGSNIGECTPGTYICDPQGNIVCFGGTSGINELCDNKDNDCDGVIDNGDPESGAQCGKDVGECEFGVEHCVGGVLVCVGGVGPSEEICDGKDNDCDGTADNFAICPEGSQCIEGECSAPCQSGEFPCPGGQICQNGFCVPLSCDDITCDPGETCVDGVCISADAGAPGGGSPGTGGSTATGGGQVGGSGTTPATGGATPASQSSNYVLPSGGGGLLCTLSAPGVTASGKDRGLWVGMMLLLGASGFFVRRRRIIAARTIAATVVAMAGIGGAATVLAGCSLEPTCIGCADESPTGTLTDSSGGNGSGGNQPGLGGGGFGIDPGCTDTLSDPQNCGTCGYECELPHAFPKCVNGICLIDYCEPGFYNDDKLDPNGCEYECTQTNGGVEICDYKDNDCNGELDELTDTSSDPLHCGMCDHPCSYANAEGICTNSLCEMGDCFVGFHNDNIITSDGCEYPCTETHGGVEACDLQDNDCDGDVDEGFVLDTDPDNCGSCGFNCDDLYYNMEGLCSGGLCSPGPCKTNYYNADLNPANGCEYYCLPVTPGSELCDGEDNDCDGVADNGTLPGVGNSCGQTDVGECEYGTYVCLSGSLTCVDEVGPTAEYCDGLDNNCAGGTDEGCPQAQGLDSRLDQGSGVGAATSTQLSVASLGDVVVAAYLDRRSGGPDIRANISTDAGANWQSPDSGVATSGSVQVEPFAFLSTTTAYIAYAEFSGGVRNIYVASSTSGYAGFNTPVRADSVAPGDDAFYVRGVVVQSGSPDSVVLVWQSFNVGALTNNIYVRGSLDGGQSFVGPELQVNSVAGQATQPVVATDGAGKAFIAWRDLRNGKTEVFVDTYELSTNSLSGNSPLSAGYDSENITIAADAGGSNVYVAWTDLRNPKKAIRLNRSNTSGGSWQGDGAIINVDSTFADSLQPSLAARGGRVVVAWQDTRSGLDDIYVNYSGNGGVSFASQTARVDLGDPMGTTKATSPRVALGAGDVVYVAWQDYRNGQPDIYGNHSFDQGASFQPLDVRMDVGTTGAPSPAGATDSRAPHIAANAAGDRMIALWVDYRTATGTNGYYADIYANYMQ